MTVCPVALVVGCKKCPAVTVCPLKGVIGDFKQPEKGQAKQQANETKRGAR